MYMYSDRRGNGQKSPRTQPSPRTIETEFVQGAFVRVFVLGLLKIEGVPGCVTKCDKGGGKNWLAKNSVLYGRPLCCQCVRLLCVKFVVHQNESNLKFETKV